MKLFDVAWKDMRQSYRSLTGIMFMFVVPILVTGLFYFLFGGTGQDNNFSLPQTTVVIVNQDQGQLPAVQLSGADLPANGGVNLNQISSMGQLLQEILQQEAFSSLLEVSITDDAEAAYSAVDNQEVNVALIIPPNFTDALMLPGETADIELYHDPTLTLGPAIVKSLIQQFADDFSFPKIGTTVTLEQLAESGLQIDGNLSQSVIGEFTAVALGRPQTGQPLISVRSPSGQEEESNPTTEIISGIMGGMMIFFAFFTGAGTLQSILVEEEKGTLSRLFTTPTPIVVIIGGKVIGTLLILTVQVTVLLLFGRLVFGIRWGDPLPLFLTASGIVLISAATGLFLASAVKSTRQSGVIYGGVLTLTGMIGLISIFTGGQASPTLQTITLIVPQGWAVRGLQAAMSGSNASEMLPSLAGLLVWIILFVAIGQYRLQRRFA